MSLFTRALGGAGAAAQDMAGVWIREESQMNLQNNQGRIAADSQKAQADIDAGKARLINELRMGADSKQTLDREAAARRQTEFESSPEMIDRAAEREGKITRARSDNTDRVLSPGQQLHREGAPPLTNSRATSQEVQDKLYRDQLKGARAKADTTDKTDKELSADNRKRISVYENTITQTQKEIGRIQENRSIMRAIEKDPNGEQAKRLQELQERVIDRESRLMKILDGGAPAGGTPKSSSATTKLPAGARQIGTSKGKPVYETPDGQRFIGQ